MSETKARKLSLVYQDPQASTVRPEFGTPSQPEQDSFVPNATPQASRQLCPSPNSIPQRSVHDALLPCGRHTLPQMTRNLVLLISRFAL